MNKPVKEPSEADLIEASYHVATLPADDPLQNADLRDVAILLMEVSEEIDRIIVVDHYDPKKRHYKVVPRNPWNRAEFTDVGIKLGKLVDSDVYRQETRPPETQRSYTQRQARGLARKDWIKAARTLES